MKNRNRYIHLGFLSVLGAGVALSAPIGCATTKHDMVRAPEGKVSVCSKCYDTVRTVWDAQGGRVFGPSVKRTIVTHHCEECRSDMTIYEEGGVIMVRCPSCAPEGVACDRCVPTGRAK